MIIEDSFLNLSWICVNEIEKKILLEVLGLRVDEFIEWQDGCDLIENSFDEKIFLSFRVKKWEFLIGKYFFSDKETIKEVMNELSLNSKEVSSFAIDVWSNFYCYSKSVNGANIRFWNENDEKVIDEGNILNVEKEIIEDETANRILELANRTTIRFEEIKKFLNGKEVQVLK